ncbi:nitrogen regulation protein NR(I) [Paracandidimonas soli]|uniref:nitrogen regulation protein NR(I) n=1 Tax=Paracandidimonas soli TaxID=1917182 RepID=UPI00334149F4
MSAVWIVDDDQSIRWVLEKAMGRVSLPVRSFASGDEALLALQGARPSVLVTDIRMPGRDGLSLLNRIRKDYPEIAVIVMTAFSDLSSTVAAFQRGAYDYLTKPFDIDAAVALIQRAVNEHGQKAPPVPQAEDDTLPESALNPEAYPAATQGIAKKALLQSASPAMQDVYRAIGRLAGSSATVLITGESGTGKELVARALHEHSARAKGPFVALNAAAIPKDLLEAELFGHERGAFTGAAQSRRGRFEEADGGTLFLDEIGDMPFELQTRLLRVLADGCFYRIGGSQAVKVDVRIVTATHQPLEQRVAQGQFREDLFHRLNVIRLRLPALRDRKEDIPALARLFLQNSAGSLGVPVRILEDDAMRALQAFDYPGNVRQLENICQWLSVMAPSQRVHARDLPPEVLEKDVRQPGEPFSDAAPGATAAGAAGGEPEQGGAGWLALLEEDVSGRLACNEPALMSSMLRDFEKVLIAAALRHTHGRRAEAAMRLGIGRNTLTRKCAELGLDDR